MFKEKLFPFGFIFQNRNMSQRRLMIDRAAKNGEYIEGLITNFWCIKRNCHAADALKRNIPHKLLIELMNTGIPKDSGEQYIAEKCILLSIWPYTDEYIFKVSKCEKASDNGYCILTGAINPVWIGVFRARKYHYVYMFIMCCMGFK